MGMVIKAGTPIWFAPHANAVKYRLAHDTEVMASIGDTVASLTHTQDIQEEVEANAVRFLERVIAADIKELR